MSQAQQPDPTVYTSGRDRYIRFAEDFLDVQLSTDQKRVLRTIATNQRTLVWGANGPGKSFVVAVLKLSFLYTNPDSIVLGTSGSFGQYVDTMWQPLEGLHDHASEEHGLPGETKGGNRPRLDIDNEWYAKVVSPRSPKELEGRHGSAVLIVIDEADKPYVTEEHFDSGGSSITDLNDRMVAVCNPPEDEADVTAQKYDDPRWEVVELSAFDSHNVQVDAGQLNADRIDGLVDLITVASDWESWNGRQWPLAESEYPGQWPGMAEIENRLNDNSLARDRVLEWLRPGLDQVRQAHEEYNTLDRRWYIRRAGVIPPQGSTAHRPIQMADVKAAWRRDPPDQTSETPQAVGIDVARSNDKTVMIGEHGRELQVHYSRTGDNHETQKHDVVDGTATTKGIREWARPDIAVDKGYAPGFYDYVNDRCPNVTPFQNGTEPVETTRWYDKWAEALHHLGKWLEDGGVIYDQDLREELIVAARVVEYEERTLKSRGENGSEVYKATSKDAIKDELGRSPDHLDAALMALWILETERAGKQRLTW